MDAKTEGLVVIHVAKPRDRSERGSDHLPTVLAALVLAGMFVESDRSFARPAILKGEVFQPWQGIELLGAFD